MLATIMATTLRLAAPEGPAEGPVASPRDAFQLDAIGAVGLFPLDGGVGLWPRWARTVWSTRRAEGALVLGAYAMGRYKLLRGDPWASRDYELTGLEQRYQLWATVGHVFRFLRSRRLEFGVHVGAGGAWLRGAADVGDPVHGWSRRVSLRGGAPSAGVMLDLGGWITPNFRMGLLLNFTAPISTTVAQYGWVGVTLGLRIPGRAR